MAALAGLIAVSAVSAAPQKNKRPAEGVVVGTVFQSSGHPLRGAKVEIVREGQAGFKQSTFSDARGDFAFRVPVGPTVYLITATAKGFEPAQKSVDLQGDERVRRNLILSPLTESEKPKPSP